MIIGVSSTHSCPSQIADAHISHQHAQLQTGPVAESTRISDSCIENGRQQSCSFTKIIEVFELVDQRFGQCFQAR